MSIVLHGIGLGGGITIGNAYLLDRNLDNAIFRALEKLEIKIEVERFLQALKETRRELEILRNNIPLNAPAELGAFLSLNIMMLGDSQISQCPIAIIRAEECNAEWAIKLQAEKLARQFDDMEDEYLKERKHDVIQVLERIFKNLEGNNFDWDRGGKLERGVLITHDLSPADLVHFKESNFSGFITEVGSLTSHTAIIGRNLDIPAVVGCSYARQLVRDEETVIVDGISGVLIINPDNLVLEEYKRRQEEWRKSRERLNLIRKQSAITEDGVTVELLANIEMPDDIEEVKYSNADGIGLFRSEFLFLGEESHLVSEDEQFEAYYKVARAMKKKFVTIRTADLGADKNPLWNMDNELQTNPALGLTGIRLSLAETKFFHTQLRAILRASHYGNIQVMFPMVSSSQEVRQAINHLEYVKQELSSDGIAFNPNIKIGAMIEVPSAALSIKSILAQVDFISIGTNDLIQYLLAIDRNDESVSYLYNPFHPAVLQVISQVIKSATRESIPVSICGEMAGSERMVRLLLGMGLRRFSMYTPNILPVKSIIRNTNLHNITQIMRKIMRSDNPDRVEELVDELNADL